MDRPCLRLLYFFFSYRDGAFWGTHVMFVVSVLGCVAVVVIMVARMPVGVFRTDSATSDQAVPQFDRNVFVNGAGMRLLFLHPQFRQQIENDARLDLKLSRQLVDPNFLHRRDC
jgi:hypothetical protein